MVLRRRLTEAEGEDEVQREYEADLVPLDEQRPFEPDLVNIADDENEDHEDDCYCYRPERVVDPGVALLDLEGRVERVHCALEAVVDQGEEVKRLDKID